MPENTPVFGFTYPCPGDPVDAASFATLANQIDAQLQVMQGDEDWALGLYSAQQIMSPSQSGIVAGVDTTLSNAGSTYVLPASGVWIFNIENVVTGFTTLDSFRLRLRQAGTELPGRTYNNETAYTVPGPMPVTTMIHGQGGELIDVRFTFWGTGTATTSLKLEARMVVRDLQ